MGQHSESLSSDERSVLTKAWKVRDKAYAPYSDYQVGAAIRDEHGNVHAGCNVENGAYKGTHAERSAISALIASGATTIQFITIVTKNAGTPCGDCCQHIWEFCSDNRNVPVLCQSVRGKLKRFTIGELLPHAFELKPPKRRKHRKVAGQT